MWDMETGDRKFTLWASSAPPLSEMQACSNSYFIPTIILHDVSHLHSQIMKYSCLVACCPSFGFQNNIIPLGLFRCSMWSVRAPSACQQKYSSQQNIATTLYCSHETGRPWAVFAWLFPSVEVVGTILWLFYWKTTTRIFDCCNPLETKSVKHILIDWCFSYQILMWFAVLWLACL